MSPTMQTTFLSDEDVAMVQTILATHGLSGFDASVRLWGRGKAIDVKGTFGPQELSCLAAIARFLGERPASIASPEAANAPAIDFVPPTVAPPPQAVAG